MKKEKRAKQTLRLLKWIRKYPGRWKLICEPGEGNMNFEIMQSLIKSLAKAGFYEMIFVLLEVHKNEEFMKTVAEAMFRDLIIEQWERGNKGNVIGKFIMYLE